MANLRLFKAEAFSEIIGQASVTATDPPDASLIIRNAIRDDEIDLDAGNDPDEWNVYLMSVPHKKKGRRTK